MQYTKPAVVKVVSALSAIESQQSENPSKPRANFVDGLHACTIGAYEADE